MFLQVYRSSLRTLRLPPRLVPSSPGPKVSLYTGCAVTLPPTRSEASFTLTTCSCCGAATEAVGDGAGDSEGGGVEVVPPCGEVSQEDSKSNVTMARGVRNLI